MKYKFIPYDTKLISRARELRKSETEAERKFWQQILKSNQLKKFKFTRQKPIGNFIADFYCAKFKLAIEIDGELHDFQKIRDKERDNFLWQKFQVKVLRFKNDEILRDTQKILDKLAEILKIFKSP